MQERPCPASDSSDERVELRVPEPPHQEEDEVEGPPPDGVEGRPDGSIANDPLAIHDACTMYVDSDDWLKKLAKERELNLRVLALNVVRRGHLLEERSGTT